MTLYALRIRVTDQLIIMGVYLEVTCIGRYLTRRKYRTYQNVYSNSVEASSKDTNHPCLCIIHAIRSIPDTQYWFKKLF
jgi:hypothetical protein